VVSKSKDESSGESKLVQSDNGFAVGGVVEVDLTGGHGFDLRGRAGGDDGGLIGVGEARDPADAGEADGEADRLAALHKGDVNGWVFVFDEDVVGEVDEDLRAGLVDAVAGDVGQRVADEDALAVVGDEEDGEEEDEEEELLQCAGLRGLM
jgi:hypothetical protein